MGHAQCKGQIPKLFFFQPRRQKKSLQARSWTPADFVILVPKSPMASSPPPPPIHTVLAATLLLLVYVLPLSAFPPNLDPEEELEEEGSGCRR